MCPKNAQNSFMDVQYAKHVFSAGINKRRARLVALIFIAAILLCLGIATVLTMVARRLAGISSGAGVV